MKKITHLFFTLRAGEWVHISVVPRGKACACVCPGCGAELIAKKGVRNLHHFAHAHGQVCTHPLETTLHRLAKALLVNKKHIYTPPLQAYKAKVLRPGRQEKFSRAREEVTLGQVRLDVLLEDGEQQLGVEIKVTHPCTSAKVRLLAQLDLPTIELDMLRIYEQHILHYPNGDLYQLAHSILYGTQNRRWLFHPWPHRYEYRLAQRATVLPVKISKQGRYQHYHVYRCPRKFRFVRGGFRDGQAYARVFQDCLHCEHCQEIRYRQEHVGYRQISTLPEQVYCGGSDAE